MITAVAQGDDGTRIFMFGISRENVTRLTAGKPIRVSAGSHPGFPADVTMLIVFGETEHMLADAMKPFIGDDTKITGLPPEPAGPIVGATGQFPYGHADADDEGELRIALATDVRNAIVRILFGKRIGSLGLPAKEARELGALLIEKANELDKGKS